MDLIVDVQCVKRSATGIAFKEVAVLDLWNAKAEPAVYIFKPPLDWEELDEAQKKENRWLERNHSGIPYNFGHIPYFEVVDVIQHALKGARAVYVKGPEKKKWLLGMAPNIRNIEDLGCPSLKNLYHDDTVVCTYHSLNRRNPVCAVKNVTAIKKWMLQRMEDL